MRAEALQLHDVGVTRSGKAILSGVTLDIPQGEITVVVGPNGAGKSTLLNVLAGTVRPDSGQVSLDGLALETFSPEALACRRAVLGQETPLAFPFRVEEVVELGRIPHPRVGRAENLAACNQAMNLAGVIGLRRRNFLTLSGGEKQRVHLARVLAQLDNAAQAGCWLMLDEPTSALDLRHQHGTLRLVRSLSRERGLGVLAVLHDLNHAMEYADHVVILESGRVVCCGKPEDVLVSCRIREVFGVEVRIVSLPGCSRPSIVRGRDDFEIFSPAGGDRG
ncbi:MAG: heme ABC transporter ATP-binding protein [Terrimicrobiaceae bacterium]